ncbi:hypothetical protein [Nocardiopsis dassonvillei]|uniref:hypothetical protein n=1 Tax=Nocardiopsis dassonvillei TaxID=2014 RepID=UPI0033F104FF
MLTKQAQRALELLYRRANKTTDAFELERIDRALDEVIRLNAQDPAPFQVRSAYAHAGALMRNRRDLAPTVSHEELAPHREPGTPDCRFPIVDILQWVRSTPSLTTDQRTLLQDLSNGYEVSDLAAAQGIPTKRMSERVCRLRKHARTAYHAQVRAA